MRRTRFVVLVALLICLAAPVREAAAVPGVALSVSPVKLELRADPGHSVEATMSVTNVGARPVEIVSSARDFVPSGESGKTEFVEDTRSPWSMSPWVTTAPSRASLQPGKSLVATITIVVPPDAEPGGHYAAALFSSIPGTAGPTPVVASVGTLLLLQVSGAVKELAWCEVVAPWLAEPVPLEAGLRFTNEGNTHVKARGGLEIASVFGGRSEPFPLKPENVLPSSARLFMMKWAAPPTFGVFWVSGRMQYGPSGTLVVAPRRLLMIMPWKLVLAGLGLFVLGLLSSLLSRRRGRGGATTP